MASGESDTPTMAQRSRRPLRCGAEAPATCGRFECSARQCRPRVIRLRTHGPRWADSPQTIERINSESADADTVDIPGPGSAREAPRYPSPHKPSTLPADVHAPAREDGRLSPVSGRPPMVSAVAGDLQVDMIGPSGPSLRRNPRRYDPGRGATGTERTLPLAPRDHCHRRKARYRANYEILGELGRGGWASSTRPATAG